MKRHDRVKEAIREELHNENFLLVEDFLDEHFQNQATIKENLDLFKKFKEGVKGVKE